jgi:hypothetical protein
VRPYSVLLAMARASSKLVDLMMARTGPKISSREMRAVGATSAITVGAM